MLFQVQEALTRFGMACARISWNASRICALSMSTMRPPTGSRVFIIDLRSKTSTPKPGRSLGSLARQRNASSRTFAETASPGGELGAGGGHSGGHAPICSGVTSENGGRPTTASYTMAPYA